MALNRELTCRQCIYGNAETGFCELHGYEYNAEKVCPQYSQKTADEMKLKRRISIHRADVDKAVTALQVIFGKMELDKKMRIIIDYDPQTSSVQINFFARHD